MCIFPVGMSFFTKPEWRKKEKKREIIINNRYKKAK